MIKSCNVVIRVATVMVVTFLFSNPSIAEDNTHDLFFTLENERQLPSNERISEFDCSDKVYAVMNLKGIELGKHQLAVLWYAPNEEVREHTKFEIFVRTPEVRQWAWLKLHRAFGASMLQLLNPAAGMEEFIGDWKVEVKIDNKLIVSKGFKVIC